MQVSYTTWFKVTKSIHILAFKIELGWVAIIVTRLATINLPKSLTFLGNFYKGVKIYYFSSEIIFGQPL